MLALIFQVLIQPRQLLFNWKYFSAHSQYRKEQKTASTSADWSESDAKASLFCLERLSALKTGHLETSSAVLLGIPPTLLFAITGKRYKSSIIAAAVWIGAPRLWSQDQTSAVGKRSKSGKQTARLA